MKENSHGKLPDIRITIVIDAPIHKVWQATATSEGLAEWLMPNDFQPIMRYEFTFRSQPQGDFDGIVHCKVTELDPPNRLAFTWSGNKGGNMLHQHVSFELKELEGQTQFTLVHSGWSEEHAVLRGIMEDGWGYKTRGLRDKLGEE